MHFENSVDLRAEEAAGKSNTEGDKEARCRQEGWIVVAFWPKEVARLPNRANRRDESITLRT